MTSDAPEAEERVAPVPQAAVAAPAPPGARRDGGPFAQRRASGGPARARAGLGSLPRPRPAGAPGVEREWTASGRGGRCE